VVEREERSWNEEEEKEKKKQAKAKQRHKPFRDPLSASKVAWTKLAR